MLWRYYSDYLITLQISKFLYSGNIVKYIVIVNPLSQKVHIVKTTIFLIKSKSKLHITKLSKLILIYFVHLN